MAFREDLERVLELAYMSPICPHTVYTFHVNDEKKTGRASVLLHHILGYEETSTVEGRLGAMTEFKHSLKWYRLRHKNRGILKAYLHGTTFSHATSLRQAYDMT